MLRWEDLKELSRTDSIRLYFNSIRLNLNFYRILIVLMLNRRLHKSDFYTLYWYKYSLFTVILFIRISYLFLLRVTRRLKCTETDSTILLQTHLQHHRLGRTNSTTDSAWSLETPCHVVYNDRHWNWGHFWNVNVSKCLIEMETLHYIYRYI